MIKDALIGIPPAEDADTKRMRAHAAAARRVDELRREGKGESLLRSLSAPMDVDQDEVRRILEADLTEG